MRCADTDPLAVRKKFVQMELDMTLAMCRAGVPFMAGTDTAAGVHIFPGFSLHDELGLFVKAGLTPMQALQTATRNPAQFLGRLDELGTVEQGKIAWHTTINDVFPELHEVIDDDWQGVTLEQLLAWTTAR